MGVGGCVAAGLGELAGLPAGMVAVTVGNSAAGLGLADGRSLSGADRHEARPRVAVRESSIRRVAAALARCGLTSNPSNDDAG